MTTEIKKPECRFDAKAHAYWYGSDRMDHPTGVLKELGYIYTGDTTRKDGLDALQVGQFAHKALELYVLGKLNWKSVDPRIVGYVKSGALWLDRHVETVHAAEEKRFNIPYLLAGTIDLRAKTDISTLPFIIDYTISANARWKKYQTGAYETLSDADHLRACLGLQEDGSMAHFHQHTNPNDRLIFLSMLNATRAMRADGIHVVRGRQ